MLKQFYQPSDLINFEHRVGSNLLGNPVDKSRSLYFEMLCSKLSIGWIFYNVNPKIKPIINTWQGKELKYSW